jgi:hypothetical protein
MLRWEFLHFAQTIVVQCRRGQLAIALDEADMGGETAGDEIMHRDIEIAGQRLFELRHLRAAVAPNRAAVGNHRAHDDLEQCRFAGAIAPDQAHPFAFIEREIGVVEDQLVAEVEIDVVKGEQGHGAGLSGARRAGNECATLAARRMENHRLRSTPSKNTLRQR